MRGSPAPCAGRGAAGMGSQNASRGAHLRAPTPQPRRALSHCSYAVQDDGNGESARAPLSATPEAVAAAARAAAAASLLLAASAAPAAAGEWHPRRHHRRIQDDALEAGSRARSRSAAAAAAARREQTTAAAAAAPSEAAKDLAAMFSQAEKAAKKSYRALTKTIQGQGADRSVYSVGVSGRPDPAAYYSRAPAPAAEGSPLGWWAVGAALAAAAYAKWGGALRRAWARRGGGGQSGRWVRDRSLGGRLVFVPDATDAPSPRPLWQDDEDFTSDVAAAAAARAARAAVASPAAAVAEDAEPVWWAPPAPVSYLSASRKEELAKRAKAALKYLEDCKLAGQEYPLPALLELRKSCSDGGGVTVRPSTESGRDAILRAAIRYAADAALFSDAAGILGGYEPGRFVSGLATDLGVPPKRAITIAHGEVAATCRSALIDAEAAYRAGDQDRLLDSLGRMVATLGAFPLPPGSPQAEMVGATIQAQTTIQFREAVFKAAGSADLRVAPVVAEMLGFDPAQVMETLRMEIAVAAAAQGGAAGGGGASADQGTAASTDSDAY